MASIKLGLQTDFRDYYDFAFHPIASADTVVDRIANGVGFSRYEQFEILNDLGFSTPKHGKALDLSTKYDRLVVYTDEFKHCGKGKILVETTDIRSSWVTKYASEYIDAEVGKSYRLLFIGNRAFYYEYQSVDWRSNVGENVQISYPREIHSCDIFDNIWFDRQNHHIDVLPIFAIDFVKSYQGKMLAVDFNTAPGLKYTQMSDLLSGIQVYDEVLKFLLL
jgi:hypothetical protein